MTSRFKDKLKRIRDDSERRSVIHMKLRSDEDVQRSQRTVKSFEFRESIEAVIEELAANFQSEATGFILTRGFYEGKYMLSLRVDEELLDEDGAAQRYFSRLMFLLDPRSEESTFDVQCRKTVRNNDLETTNHTAPMEKDGLASFAQFIEAQFLAFAEAYFADTSLTRPSPVGEEA